MRAVLADTGPLYAQVDPDDGHHRRAREEAKRLAASGIRVAVAQPVVLEAYTLILHQLGIPVALRWLEETRSRAGLLNPTSRDYAAASELLGRYGDQPISLFDAVSARLSNEFDLPVWTYDHQFDLMGVSVWRVETHR